MKRWYAIHTFSGQENNIKKHIEQMIEREGVQDKFGQVIVPTREVVSNVRGKRRTSIQNLFPAYIIIEMELDELTQHLVTTINGVTHFAGTTRANRVPVPLQQSEVDRLLCEVEHAVGGEHDEDRGRTELADLPDRINAVDARHADVHDRDVRPESFRGFDDRPTGPC